MKNIVVQGGTFYNDAVLRSFELLSGREVIRPNISGIMGAFGCALLQKKDMIEGVKSSLLAKDKIDEFEMKTHHVKRCGSCGK